MLMDLITLSLTLSLIFIFLSHPLSLGFILLMQTIIASLILGNLNLNFWFSYILFLIMIGGMLVLFIYMTSIASDEKFKFSKTLSMIFLAYLMLYMMILPMDNFLSWMEFTNSSLLNSNSSEVNFCMNKLTNEPNWMIFLMLIIYLLMTLIAIVKIAYTKYGTLRPSS